MKTGFVVQRPDHNHTKHLWDILKFCLTRPPHLLSVTDLTNSLVAEWITLHSQAPNSSGKLSKKSGAYCKSKEE